MEKSKTAAFGKTLAKAADKYSRVGRANAAGALKERKQYNDGI